MAALDRLSKAGISLGCQTVLLRGVNDDPKVMMKLMHELLKARVRPYYIYMADQVAGGGKVPLLPEYIEEINDDEVIFRNFQGQRFTYKQPKPYDGSGTPDIVPIEIAAKKQRTAAKKASRPRRRKASGE